MCSKMKITKSTKNYSACLQIKKLLNECDSVLIGAGAGLSVSEGFSYSGKRFEKYFSDFKNKYGFSDMYSGGFYPYKTLEEYWAYRLRSGSTFAAETKTEGDGKETLNSPAEGSYTVNEPFSSTAPVVFALYVRLLQPCFLEKTVPTATCGIEAEEATCILERSSTVPIPA